MIPEPLQPYVPDWVILIFATIGVLVALLKTVEFLFNFLPTLKINTYDVVAKWTKNKKIIKAAQAAKIEQTINQTISEFQNELPVGWLKKASLNWVTKESAPQLGDNEIVLRIRPVELQDTNLAAALHACVKQAIFPEVREILPAVIFNSTSVKISGRILAEKHPYSLESFNREFVEPQIKNDPSLLLYLEKYDLIDSKGFFSAIFIREFNEIVKRARHKSLRLKLTDEADALLIHIKNFLNKYESKNNPQLVLQDYWHRIGPETSYAILLVARPEARNIGGYVKRARDWVDKDVERLYVMGTKDGKDFVEQVFYALNRLPEYRLAEIFYPYRDYRGNLGGMCALYVNKKLEKL
jgi:hypothetical protein